VDHGLVYVGSGDGKLYALGAAGGGVVWSTATGAAIESSPTIYRGLVYVGSDDTKL
jgi:outer membrane protein assembly factor BamB